VEEEMKKYLPKLVFVVAVLLTISIVFASCKKESPIRLFDKGIGLLSSDSYKEAIYYLSRAIEIDPEYAEAYYVRGLTYFKMKNYEEAIADFTRCIDYNPTHAKAFISRGYAYEEIKDFRKAISNYTKVIEIDPSNSFCYYLRGSIYNLRGEHYDYDKAVKDFDMGCKLGDIDSCKKIKELLEE
jgi:tetratricopeptide (TPR) repeat protein